MSRRRLTPALTLFGIALFNVPMLVLGGASFFSYLPNSSASFGWVLMILVIPTFLTSVVAGLLAAFGAFLAARSRGTSASNKRPTGSTAPAVGAGLGGSIGAVPLLVFLSWWYQNGPGGWILVVGLCITFTGFAWFTAVRGVPTRSSRT